MSPMQVCPSSETLSDYLVGKLGNEEADSVTSHLKVCDGCVAKMDEFDESLDSMVQKLKHPGADDAFMREPECQQAVLASAPLAGEQVDSDLGQIRDYQLVCKLGEGGMGTVYEAIHMRLDQTVAIKVLPPERMDSVESVKRFHREMRAIGKLDHPHIVRAQDAGEVDGKHYLVMELVKGIDLSALVNRLGPLPFADACELIRQAAIGLQHVHEHGFIHRDIKPSNLMVTPEGNVKILDLGLARLHEGARESKELTFEGQVMGTLDYMSPEQLGDAHKVDIRADIYGLGATMFKLLSGEAPYAGQEYNTPTKKLVAIATKPAPPIADFRDDMPPALISVLDRMLAKNPDERYSQPAEIVVALEPFANGCELPELVAKAMPATDPKVDQASVSTFDHVASAHADTKPTPTLSNVQPAGHSSPSQSWFKRPQQVAAAACLFFVGMLAVYYVTTNNGTLVVEVDDEQIGVMLKSQGIVVHDLKNNRQWSLWEPGETKLSVGDFRLTVRDDSGLEVETEEFTLKRGENKIVSIRRRDVPHETINDEPLASGRRDPISESAFVAKPASISGVESWTVVTRDPIGGTTALRLSPTGNLLAIGSADGVIRLRNVETNRLVRALVGHNLSVSSVEWSHDSRLLASSSDDHTVRIWHSESGLPVVVLRGHTDQVFDVAWSADDKSLASVGRDNTLRIWDVPTGQLLETSKTESAVKCVDWSPNGQLVATKETNGTITLWEPAAATPTSHISGEQAPYGAVVRWSPDGQLLACSTHEKLTIWELNSARHLATLESTGSMAWSPDAKQIVTGGGIWDARTGVREREISGFPSSVYRIDWQLQGDIIALADQTVQLWDVTSGQRKRVYRTHPTQASSNGYYKASDNIACSGTGMFVGAFEPRTIQRSFFPFYFWDMEHGRMRRIEREPHSIVWHDWNFVASPNGSYLAHTKATGTKKDIQIAVIDAADGNLIRELSGDLAFINAMIWSPDSRLLVSVAEDNTASVWNVEKGEQVHTLRHDAHSSAARAPRGVFAVAYSPNGRTIATADDQRVYLWDAESGEQASVLEVSGGKLLSFSPDSRTLAIANGEYDNPHIAYDNVRHFPNTSILQLWDVEAGLRLDTIDMHAPQAIALKWQGTHSIAVCSPDNTVRSWDTGPDKPLIGTVEYPGAQAHSATFSTDGSRLLVAGDNVIRTVDLQSARSRAHVALRDGQYLTLNDDGHYVGSPRVERHLVYVAQTEQGQETLTPSEFTAKYDWTNDPSRVRFDDGGGEPTVQLAVPALRVEDEPIRDLNSPSSDPVSTLVWYPTPQQQAFLDAVVKLSVEERIEVVTGQLKKINPGYNATFDPTVVDGSVGELSIREGWYPDLWPLAALTALTSLDAYIAPQSNVAPLTTLPLKHLKQFAISPLNSRAEEVVHALVQLEEINGVRPQAWLGRRQEIEDLRAILPALSVDSQVERVVEKLREYNPGFDGSTVTHWVDDNHVHVVLNDQPYLLDASPLRALELLNNVECNSTMLSDLTPFTGTSVKLLSVNETRVSDLTPLRELALIHLSCNSTAVTDLTPISRQPLIGLYCGLTGVSDVTPLTQLKLTVLYLSGTQVSDLSPLAGMPLTNLAISYTSISDIRPLADCELTEFSCQATPISDLSPLRGMPLTFLNCSYSRVSDLSPLQGLELKVLLLRDTDVDDLSPLAGMPLTILDCSCTRVEDISPLAGMPINRLHLLHLKLFDLSTLAGMPIRILDIEGTFPSDLSPLEGMPLEQLTCNRAGLSSTLLRHLPSFTTINGKPADEVLKKLTVYESVADRTPSGDATGANLLRPIRRPESWTLGQYHGARATMGVDADSLVLQTLKVGRLNWHAQVWQNGLALKEGQPYTLKCKIKSEDNCTVAIFAGVVTASDGHDFGLNQAVRPQREFADYEFSFVAQDVVEDHNQVSFSFGFSVGSVVIKDVALYER